MLELNMLQFNIFVGVLSHGWVSPGSWRWQVRFGAAATRASLDLCHWAAAELFVCLPPCEYEAPYL